MPRPERTTHHGMQIACAAMVTDFQKRRASKSLSSRSLCSARHWFSACLFRASNPGGPAALLFFLSNWRAVLRHVVALVSVGHGDWEVGRQEREVGGVAPRAPGEGSCAVGHAVADEGRNLDHHEEEARHSTRIEKEKAQDGLWSRKPHQWCQAHRQPLQRMKARPNLDIIDPGAIASWQRWLASRPR